MLDQIRRMKDEAAEAVGGTAPRWQPAVHLLVAALIACAVLPVILLAYAAWSVDRDLHRQADQRISVSLDVLTQHTLKVFQTAELALYAMQLATEGMTDAQIIASEPRLHARLGELARALPQVQSLWLIGRDGHPMVTTRASPPPAIDLSERDYFRKLKAQGDGLYIGSIMEPMLPGPRFFFFGRRRATADGAFAGVYDVSLNPTDFERFYGELDPDRTQLHALVRADGAVLARFPTSRQMTMEDPTRSALLRAAVLHPNSGRFKTRSLLDGVERVLGYRRVPGYDLYVVAGIETGSIAAAWRATLASHLIFGVPATLLLLLTLVIAIQRTRHLAVEAERRQAAEAALSRRLRLEALGQLTGGVAHDFNNLLTIIRGSAEQLMRRTEPTRTAELRSLAAIETAVDRGAALTRQLLTFASRQPLAVEVIDLGPHITRLADEMLRRSLRGDIHCVVTTAATPCRAKADPGELDLALLNIAVNARDAMPAGGELTLTVGPVQLAGSPAHEGLAGDFIAISVRDTGGGIPPEVLPRVFEPFFTTKETGRGTGLGLSQVYGFARQSGGTVTVASQAGRGTEVTLYLPACTEAPTPPAKPVAVPAGRGGRCVLLVEDNAEVAEVTRGVLADLGFRVELARTADAALERLRQGRICDLVLSDMMMPGAMNGIDLARAVRQRFPDLPVVLASGFSAEAETAIREGFTFLQKPYHIDRLREVLG